MAAGDAAGPRRPPLPGSNGGARVRARASPPGTPSRGRATTRAAAGTSDASISGALGGPTGGTESAPNAPRRTARGAHDNQPARCRMPRVRRAAGDLQRAAIREGSADARTTQGAPRGAAGAGLARGPRAPGQLLPPPGEGARPGLRARPRAGQVRPRRPTEPRSRGVLPAAAHPVLRRPAVGAPAHRDGQPAPGPPVVPGLRAGRAPARPLDPLAHPAAAGVGGVPPLLRGGGRALPGGGAGLGPRALHRRHEGRGGRLSGLAQAPLLRGGPPAAPLPDHRSRRRRGRRGRAPGRPRRRGLRLRRPC